MNMSDLRGKTIAEIEKLLAETRKELIENKRSLAASELPNPRVVGKNRRSIAQLNTVLRERANESKKGDA